MGGAEWLCATNLLLSHLITFQFYTLHKPIYSLTNPSEAVIRLQAAVCRKPQKEENLNYSARQTGQRGKNTPRPGGVLFQLVT